jgi:hypothetical protein
VPRTDRAAPRSHLAASSRCHMSSAPTRPTTTAAAPERCIQTGHRRQARRLAFHKSAGGRRPEPATVGRCFDRTAARSVWLAHKRLLIGVHGPERYLLLGSRAEPSVPARAAGGHSADGGVQRLVGHGELLRIRRGRGVAGLLGELRASGRLIMRQGICGAPSVVSPQSD